MPKPELFAPPHTLSFTSRTCSCSPREETRGRDLSDLSDGLLAAEWNSWMWSQGGQYLGVKGLHHSGANSRPESSSGALSRLPGLQGCGPRAALDRESSSLSLAGVIRGTSWCGHQAGKCGRKEEGRQRGLGKKEEGTHRAGQAGPNLAGSYFRTVPRGPQTRDLWRGASGCAQAPNPCLFKKLSAALGLPCKRGRRESWPASTCAGW